MRKGPYLGSGAENDKTKTTFPSQTLKVGEKKVHIFLCLVAPIQRYGYFLNFMSMGQIEKRAISRLRGQKWQK